MTLKPHLLFAAGMWWSQLEGTIAPGLTPREAVLRMWVVYADAVWKSIK